MARKKKIDIQTTSTISDQLVEVEIEKDFINPPEEETSGFIQEVEEDTTEQNIIEESKQGTVLRKVLRFTPVGPRIEYI